MILGTLVRPFSLPRSTVAFGTAITRFVPGYRQLRPVIDKVVATAAGTAHTLTVMAPIGKCRVAAAAAGAAASFVLTFDPGDFTKTMDYASADFMAALANRNFLANGKLLGPHNVRGYTPSVANNLIAANDWLAVRQGDSNWWWGQATAVATGSDGSITVTATVPTGGFQAGAEVHFFGTTTDTNPMTGLAHPQRPIAANDTSVFTDDLAAFAGAGMGDSLLLHDNNATATGAIDQVSGAYAAP